jgi:hypothetical protein
MNKIVTSDIKPDKISTTSQNSVLFLPRAPPKTYHI